MSVLLDRLRHALAPHYSIERELASGGMGIVFVGHAIQLDRPVAVKVLRPERASATAGAIRAWKHYLVLRADPEASLRSDAASARLELARLEDGH